MQLSYEPMFKYVYSVTICLIILYKCVMLLTGLLSCIKTVYAAVCR
jgi:hypothetical protein